jgi:hypothetical protein
MEVALGIRRRLQQLPVAVAVAIRGLDLTGGVEHEPRLRRLIEFEPVGRPPRNHDVVVLPVGDLPEHRLERARALADEDHLVPLAVAVEGLGLRVRPADRELQVRVPHQAAPARNRIAFGRHPAGHQVPVDVGFGDPLAVLDGRVLVRLRDPARRLEVIEDRLVARESLEAHHLLDQQPPVVAELDVALARDVSKLLVAHQCLPVVGFIPTGSPSSPAHARWPRTGP